MSTASAAQTYNIVSSDFEVTACGHKLFKQLPVGCLCWATGASTQQCQIKVSVIPLKPVAPVGLKEATHHHVEREIVGGQSTEAVNSVFRFRTLSRQIFVCGYSHKN